MSKEYEQASDEKATVTIFCHTCRRELYSSRESNPTTTTVAKNTAQDHGNYFSLPHQVSVLAGASTASLKEILAVNENSKSKSSPFPRKHFFIPIK